MRRDRDTAQVPLGTWGLGPDELDLYALMLRLRKATLPTLFEARAQDLATIEAELKHLTELGLVAKRDDTYVAIHPSTALQRLAAERFDRIAAAGRELSGLLDSVEVLTRHYDAGRDFGSGQLPAEVVHGVDKLFTTAATIASQAPPMELLAAVPDQRVMSEYSVRYIDTWERAFQDGLMQIRAVLQVDTLEGDGVSDVVRRVAATGGQIRTLDKVPSWFFAVGTAAVGLPLEWGGTLPEHDYTFLLVRSTVVVAAMRTLFEEMWARAVPIPGRRGEPRVAVLRLAAQGLCDDTIARHLGVSVRTVRARFADAMAELGAQSRFQAGAEATRRGWLG